MRLVRSLATFCCCLSAISPCASDSDANCRRNLLIVFDALEACRAQTGAYPESLAALCPEFLADARRLICPLAELAGDPKAGRENLRPVADFEPVSTYEYELAAGQKNELLQSLGKTPREFRLRQREILGDKAPLVRCLAKHGRRLNIGFDGSIYESGDYWEIEFRHIVPHAHLNPYWIFSDRLPLKPRLPRRGGGAPADAVDLTDWYNGHLLDDWSWERAIRDDNSLAEFHSHITSQTAVSFDARGVIQLQGGSLPPMIFPDGVTNILVGRSIERLTILHGAMGADSPGALVASLEALGEAGSIARFPIRYGRELEHWHFSSSVAATNLPNGAIAWIGHSKAARAAGEKLRLYSSSFALPEKRFIRLINYSSALAGPAPFLLAITAE